MTAARQVFAEHGYFNSRLSDITDRVGCSTGTLYTYFRNREDILAAVIEHAQQNVLRTPHTSDTDVDPVERIHRANKEYIDSYCENADLMAVMEQVSHVDPSIKKVRKDRSNAFIARNARSIGKLQDQGFVNSTLDPQLVSKALSSMVSRLCFNIYVDEKDPAYATEEGRAELIRTVSVLWTEALGLSMQTQNHS
ncbi:TetR/AcrR family transcriptional regulator [Brevibacterium yomogidense]|uniref:TetR/AcrR family transcriptional regulator n=1 Tax=Brevibacterium yomogidense TaxID=946573 RepID=UPI0018DFBC9F